MANPIQVIVPNSFRVLSNAIILTVNQPVQQLPNIKVPDMRQIQIMSNPGNAIGSVVLVDGLYVNQHSYPLAPGQTIGYAVKNANVIFVGVVGAALLAFLPLIVNYTVEIN